MNTPYRPINRSEFADSAAQADRAGKPIRAESRPPSRCRRREPTVNRLDRASWRGRDRARSDGTRPDPSPYTRRPAFGVAAAHAPDAGCAGPLVRPVMEGKDANQAGRGRDRTLARVQGAAHHALAQPPGRALLAPGQVQRRADLAATARGRRPRRPHQRGRLRPDGRHRRLRPRPAASSSRRTASRRIRGAMLDELRTMDWVPRLVRSKHTKMEEARKSLEALHGRPPTDTGARREARPADAPNTTRWRPTPTPSGSSR